jgi:hypothetical protein
MYRRGARRMTMAGRGKEVGKRKLSLQRLTMSESPEALLPSRAPITRRVRPRERAGELNKG